MPPTTVQPKPAPAAPADRPAGPPLAYSAAPKPPVPIGPKPISGAAAQAAAAQTAVVKPVAAKPTEGEAVATKVTTSKAAQAVSDESKPEPAAESAEKKESSVNAAPRAAQGAGELNWNAVFAFIMSAIGVLSPVGIWLGFRTSAQIKRDGGGGSEFATAAIVLGVLWIIVLVLGIITYQMMTA